MPNDIRPQPVGRSTAPVREPAATAAPGLATRLRTRPSGAPRRPLTKLLTAGLLILFLVFFVLPVVWLVLASTKTDDQLVHGNPLSFGSLHALRANWDALIGFQDDSIMLWLRNSALYSGIALVITLVVAVPAGYALATTEFRGRHTLLVATLVVMLMPNATLVVPLFLEVNAVHLIGSMWSIILPYSFYPFGVYLTYIYFSTALPKDLLAAARIDGCSEFGVFRHIALPLATPVVALVGFFSFVANWTNYFLPYVMLPESNQMPVQVGLGTLLDSVPSFNPTVGESAVLRPELALATLLAILPVLAVFLFSQRFLIAGMLAGATKD
jgi:multiple sugar transport system permease protein